MITELVPIILEKRLIEYRDKIIIDIEATLNGKSILSNELVNDIKNVIIKEFSF